jgi:hypothetical protein
MMLQEFWLLGMMTVDALDGEHLVSHSVNVA